MSTTRQRVSHRSGVLVALALTSLGVTPTPAGAAEATLIDRDVQPVAVAGTSVLVDGVRTPLPRLRVSRDGRPPVPVPGRTRLTSRDDPTGGTDARGRPVAVVSRCAREPGAAPGGRCRLRSIDLTTGAERTIPGTHSPGQSETYGTMQRGRVAFVRRYRDGRRAVYWRDVRGPSRRVRARGLAAGGFDVSGRWLSRVRNEDAATACGERSVVELLSVGGRSRTVTQQTCGEDGQRITGAFLRGRRVYVASTDDSAGGALARFGLDGRPAGSVAFAAELAVPYGGDRVLLSRRFPEPSFIETGCTEDQQPGEFCGLERLTGLRYGRDGGAAAVRAEAPGRRGGGLL